MISLIEGIDISSFASLIAVSSKLCQFSNLHQIKLSLFSNGFKFHSEPTFQVENLISSFSISFGLNSGSHGLLYLPNCSTKTVYKFFA